MKFNFDKARWHIDSDGTWITILVPGSHKEQVQEFVQNLHQLHTVEIKQHRNKRSLDANAYAWSLLNEMANVMRSSKEEVYLLMLKRYGQSQIIKLLTEGLPILLRAIKYYEIIKEDGDCTYVKVFTGSSEYDSREMAILIDGIISECKELGIETMTPAEIERLKGAWKNGGS